MFNSTNIKSVLSISSRYFLCDSPKLKVQAQHRTLNIAYTYRSYCDTSNMADSQAAGSDVVWSFGYGSNMDVVSLQAKKHVKIVDHVCAVLKGWKMSFTLPGPPKVEPSYANAIKGCDTDEIHGVAFCMTKESGAELDRTESGYNKECITLNAYDGRVLEGFVYANKPGALAKSEIPPSARYLGVLVNGASAAGLNKDYIKRLSEHEVYKPTEETLAIRKALPEPKDLPVITVETLAAHDSKSAEPWVAILGYVVGARSYFGSHIGRDITTRMLNQFHGIPMDDNDDRGKPPYPILNKLDPKEVEYVATWRDHYLNKTEGKVCGFVKEFLEQKNSGQSTWMLPPKPKQ